MTNRRTGPVDTENFVPLRQRAEEEFTANEAVHPETSSPEAIEKLIHELRVHQIELEMQNEEMRRAMAELDASQARYFELYDLAPIGYLTLTEKKLIKEINLAAASMFGVTRGSLVREPISRILPKEDQLIFYQQLNQCRESGLAQKWDMRLVRANGCMFWAHLKAEQAECGEYRITLSDITERKQGEEDNAKLTAQLQQARKIEAIGLLAGGVAHDFNNMLGVIIGYTEMALMKLDPSEPLYADLLEVNKAAARSAALTRQLLAFARKQTIEPTVLDLNVVIAGMVKMLQRLIGENIEFSWQPEAFLWQVLADPSQIDQILANLCVNIRDAVTDVGKATIETGNSVLDEVWCATHFGSVPGEYVRISVKDNGCGMDKEVLEHLFEPFFTTKEIGKGTGMGLATVYGIVKQNNGFLTVDSQKGEGATFTIYLPRHLGKSGQAQVKAAITPAKRNKETILVVEDEATILEMARIMLAMQGYTVLTANSPGEAVSLAREYEGEIDLLLTDVIMPEMNGRDLAGKLLSLHPGIKSLFMSGYTADVISNHGVLENGIFFLQKPFSLEGLAAKVREVLDRTL